MWRSILCLVVLVVSGCSNNNTPDTTTSANPQPHNSASQADLSEAEQDLFPTWWQAPMLQWERCDHHGALDCAELEVPMNWDDAHSPMITLLIARAVATQDRIGSIILNPGGPGASGVDFLSPRSLSNTLSSQFDIISWDPRGVGSSTSLDCEPNLGDFFQHDTDPDTPEEQRSLADAAEIIANDCSLVDGDETSLIDFLRTEDTVMDLEAIRRSLGSEPLNFLGYSYGSHIGLRYVERFPSVVRTMVLDGVVDPEEPFDMFLRNQAVGFERTLITQDQACSNAGEAQCGVANLTATFDDVVAQLESGVVNEDGEPLSPTLAVMAAVSSGYHEDGWKALADALQRSLDGDWFSLELLAELYYSGVGYESYLAVVCTDSPRPDNADDFLDFAGQLKAAAPRFGATVANELLPCAWWHAPPGPPPAPLILPATVPLLFVGAVNDPATPYAVAERLAMNAPDGQLITAHRFGHTSYGRNRCVTEHVDSYFITATLPVEDPHCEE